MKYRVAWHWQQPCLIILISSCHERILFLSTYAKVEYVSVRTYLSQNRIRTLRILKPWLPHRHIGYNTVYVYRLLTILTNRVISVRNFIPRRHPHLYRKSPLVGWFIDRSRCDWSTDTDIVKRLKHRLHYFDLHNKFYNKWKYWSLSLTGFKWHNVSNAIS